MSQQTASTDVAESAARASEKNGIKNTIARVYGSLVHVTVVTAVGGVTATLTAQDGEKIDVTLASDGTATAFVTQIDLLEGDVVSSLPENYDELQFVLALHEKNVELASKVLPANIEALVNAGRQVIKLIDAS